MSTKKLQCRDGFAEDCVRCGSFTAITAHPSPNRELCKPCYDKQRES